jgi:hypothetical protein
MNSRFEVLAPRSAHPSTIKVQAPKAQPKVTEEDLLQGFKQFVRMLNISFQPENKTSITAAEKLAAEYIPFFKDAARTLSSQHQLRTLSWDAIIDATKDSLFFEAHPEFLESHNPDLVCRQAHLREVAMLTFTDRNTSRASNIKACTSSPIPRPSSPAKLPDCWLGS